MAKGLEQIIGRRKDHTIVIGVAVGLTIVFSLISNNFVTLFNIETILGIFSVYLLASVGPTLVIIAGSLDLSYAGILTLSGVLAALFLPIGGLSILLAVLLIGTLLGLVNGFISAKVKIPSFLVTLGSLYITLGISAYLTGGFTVPLRFPLSFVLLNRPIVGLFSWAVLLAVILFLFLRYSALGIKIYGIGSSEYGSLLSGISISKTRIIVFTISGFLAASSGILLLSYVGSAGPTIGKPLIFVPLAAVLMGGTPLGGGSGGTHRTILGCYIIAVVENGLSLLGLDPQLLAVFLGAIIIVVMIVMSARAKVKIA